MSGHLVVDAPDGLPEIAAGDDLLGLLLPLLPGLLDGTGLRDGDVLVVTSKAVSKAEGRVLPGLREDHLDAETVRLVARRGPTRIVRTRHGLTLAAAGIDASNVAAGAVVLLPEDPDASARLLRAQIHARTGRNVGVVVTDTAGRAWREGQTDIAVGAAGLLVLEDHAGRVDPHGNQLAVTAPAVADEIAGAVELAAGKLAARPLAVVRGRADLVLAAGLDGAGADALVRPETGDLFGWGSREAVVRALRGEDDDAGPFGDPADADDLVDAVVRALGPHGVQVSTAGPAAVRVGHLEERWAGGLAALAFAHGWTAGPGAEPGTHQLRPRARASSGTP